MVIIGDDLMKNMRYIVVMVLLLLMIGLILLVHQYESNKLKLEFIDEKKYIDFITTDKEFYQLNKKIEEKINKENIECKQVKFIDQISQEDDVFFYFVLDDDYETLFEGLYRNSSYKFSYLGSNINTTAISKYSGYNYLQIMNPEEYKKKQELDEIITKGKTALPDDTEMP